MAVMLLTMAWYGCVSFALTTPQAMHLGPYVLLGPRFDYSNTDIIHYPTAGPGIPFEWVEDNATWNGKRHRVSGQPVLMNVGGFTLLRQ